MKYRKKEKERKAFKNKDIYNKNNNSSIHHTRTRIPMCVRTRETPLDELRYCGIRFALTTRATSSPSQNAFVAPTTAPLASCLFVPRVIQSKTSRYTARMRAHTTRLRKRHSDAPVQPLAMGPTGRINAFRGVPEKSQYKSQFV